MQTCVHTFPFLVIAALGAVAVFQLFKLRQETKQIIMNQEEFDAQIAAANAALEGVNTSLTDIAAAIVAETAEIIAFIEGLPPEVDTSALTGVVTNLETANTALSTANESISGIFTAPAPE
jgi:hypothetical protein